MSLYRIVLSDSSFSSPLSDDFIGGRATKVLTWVQCSYLELRSMVLRWSDIMYFTAEISSEIKSSVYFEEPDTVDCSRVDIVIGNYLRCWPGTQSDLVCSVCSSRGSNSKYQHIDLTSPHLTSHINTSNSLHQIWGLIVNMMMTLVLIGADYHW